MGSTCSVEESEKQRASRPAGAEVLAPWGEHIWITSFDIGGSGRGPGALSRARGKGKRSLVDVASLALLLHTRLRRWAARAARACAAKAAAVRLSAEAAVQGPQPRSGPEEELAPESATEVWQSSEQRSPVSPTRMEALRDTGDVAAAFCARRRTEDAEDAVSTIAASPCGALTDEPDAATAAEEVVPGGSAAVQEKGVEAEAGARAAARAFLESVYGAVEGRVAAAGCAAG